MLMGGFKRWYLAHTHHGELLQQLSREGDSMEGDIECGKASDLTVHTRVIRCSCKCMHALGKRASEGTGSKGEVPVTSMANSSPGTSIIWRSTAVPRATWIWLAAGRPSLTSHRLAALWAGLQACQVLLIRPQDLQQVRLGLESRRRYSVWQAKRVTRGQLESPHSLNHLAAPWQFSPSGNAYYIHQSEGTQ